MHPWFFPVKLAECSYLVWTGTCHHHHHIFESRSIYTILRKSDQFINIPITQISTKFWTKSLNFREFEPIWGIWLINKILHIKKSYKSRVICQKADFITHNIYPHLNFCTLSSSGYLPSSCMGLLLFSVWRTLIRKTEQYKTEFLKKKKEKQNSCWCILCEGCEMCGFVTSCVLLVCS